MPRWFTILGMIATLFAGCAKKEIVEARPGPGDTIFPIVNCPKSWTAGSPIAMTVKLGMQRDGEQKPQLLTFEEVPHEPELRATFTFLKDDEVVSTVADVLLTPDC